MRWWTLFSKEMREFVAAVKEADSNTERSEVVRAKVGQLIAYVQSLGQSIRQSTGRFQWRAESRELMKKITELTAAIGSQFRQN